MKNFTKVILISKIKKNGIEIGSIKNIFLLNDHNGVLTSDGVECTVDEMANCLKGFQQKAFPKYSTPIVKIKKVSYKRVPKKYMVI